MKKLSMILLTFLLAFGFTSTALANNGHGADLDPDPNRTVTYDEIKDITTVITTKVDVSYDKKVKVKKHTDYFTEKKSKTDTEKKVVVEYKKQKHPKKDWHRKIKYVKTYQINKIASWDEVTRVDKIATFTTPIKIFKTKVTTVKHYGPPENRGKFISKDVQKSVDKKYGKTKKDIANEKDVYKKNFKKHVDKKLLHVKKSFGKWMKNKR